MHFSRPYLQRYSFGVKTLLMRIGKTTLTDWKSLHPFGRRTWLFIVSACFTFLIISQKVFITLKWFSYHLKPDIKTIPKSGIRHSCPIIIKPLATENVFWFFFWGGGQPLKGFAPFWKFSFLRQKRQKSKTWPWLCTWQSFCWKKKSLSYLIFHFLCAWSLNLGLFAQTWGLSTENN